MDALSDRMRGWCFRVFTKLDLACSYQQLRVQPADQWKTSFCSLLGQFE